MAKGTKRFLWFVVSVALSAGGATASACVEPRFDLGTQLYNGCDYAVNISWSWTHDCVPPDGGTLLRPGESRMLSDKKRDLGFSFCRAPSLIHNGKCTHAK